MANRNLVRLPIDVWASDRQKHELTTLVASVREYADRYEAAIKAQDFAGRVGALWGLVARGDESRGWCGDRLQSGNPESISDACGVLAWIGTAADLVPVLQQLLAELPDGEARDAVYEVLPADQRGENDAAADQGASSEELLGGAMAPFTHIIWYVQASLEQAIAARETGGPTGPPPYRYRAHGPIDWLSAKFQVALGRPDPLSPNTPANTRQTNVRGPLPVLLSHLQPHSIPGVKSLWVRTDGEWTAVFSQGSDLSYIADYARRLKTRVLRTSYRRDAKEGSRIISHGGCSFWLYDGARGDLAASGYALRSIQASRQSGWQWDEHGEVQPFEETNRYAARRVAERFDLGMLNRYCGQLGIRREDPGFYGPDAILMEIIRKRPRHIAGATSIRRAKQARTRRH